MSSELRDHFFYKTDARKPSPKSKVCTSGRRKKGTVKVIWLPYDYEVIYPKERDNEEKPRISIPPVRREDVWKFKYWIRCIARWDEMRILEQEDEEIYSGSVVDYPIGVLYNPNDKEIEQVRWDSKKRFDYKSYNPNKGTDLQELYTYFRGYLSNEVDCEEFEEWFFEEYKSRIMEKAKRREKRRRNRNTDISYAKRGYWLDKKPEDSD